jgi:hypothetical protein
MLSPTWDIQGLRTHTGVPVPELFFVLLQVLDKLCQGEVPALAGVGLLEEQFYLILQARAHIRHVTLEISKQKSEYIPIKVSNYIKKVRKRKISYTAKVI